MISLANREDIIAFLTGRDDVFAVKQRAMLEIYRDLCDFWFQDELLLSRLSGGITLCGEAREAFLPELRSFLRAMCRSVEGEAALLERLFTGAVPLPVMEAPDLNKELLKETLKSFPMARIAVPDRLGPVYELLAESDKSFAAATRYDAWLADFSHRCRHDHACCYVLTVDTFIVATFSILFFGVRHSLGGAFAVHPQWRGKGCGALLLAHAASERPGLRLLANGENLKTYYLRRGWNECGVAARFTFTEEL